MSKLSIGIDSGSTMCKIILYDGKNILDRYISKTSWDAEQSARDGYETILVRNGLKQADVVVAATGYGREIISFAEYNYTEIKCHAIGGIFLIPRIQGIIDIGGQDSKVIRIENGRVTNFMMNDKCAAGTGRFLNMACDTLGVPLDDVDQFTSIDEAIPINSMCAVFAESEIISLLSAKRDRSKILAGVLESIAKKVYQITGKMKDISSSDPFLLTGGLARFNMLAAVIEKTIGERVITHAESPFAGALGACICACKEQ